MTIRDEIDLAGMRRVGRLVAETLEVMQQAIAVGVTTAAIDRLAERFARSAGARSAPQQVYDFPGFTLISVNDEIVHGVPGPRVIRAGDIVKIDVTLELGGYIADAARTILVPPVSSGARRLQRCARLAFARGLNAARAGHEVRAIGAAIEREVRRAGFAVVRELTGHGVGRTIHESPQVPNYADPNARRILNDGLVIAIEPMVATLPSRPIEDADGWTLRTNTGAMAVHHEQTVIVRSGAAEVLTAG